VVRVSCIIPAYNEAPRIGAVLGAVSGHPSIDEVIVIDDASTDGTKEVVSRFSGVELVSVPQNGGKSAALAEGLSRARGEFILLLDADLAGLTKGGIAALIEPVLSGNFDIALSLRINTPPLWRLIRLDYISGERVFRADLLKGRHEAVKRLSSFAFEVFLNKILIEKKSRIAVVPWPQVRSPYKHRKYGLLEGLRGDLKMMRDIYSVISPLESYLQIIRMLRLRTVVS
jgi:glycosyltransferase involved in cell wall biosynthesis